MDVTNVVMQINVLVIHVEILAIIISVLYHANKYKHIQFIYLMPATYIVYQKYYLSKGDAYSLKCYYCSEDYDCKHLYSSRSFCMKEKNTNH